MTTTNLADFGMRELSMSANILNEWVKNGLPENFYCGGVHLMMNKNSGNVFLTNEDCQVAMMNGDKLESFYSCPICGKEGFIEDIGHGDDNEECQEWLADMGVVKVNE